MSDLEINARTRLKEAKSILSENPHWKPAQERVKQLEELIARITPKKALDAVRPKNQLIYTTTPIGTERKEKA